MVRIREWLRSNSYDAIADMIDLVIDSWKAMGKRTRRNWWDILAGRRDGRSRMAGGVAFPVMRAARIRQQLPEVPNAICRNPEEQPPPVVPQGSWRNR